MRPYSTDLRKRVLDAYGRREGSLRELADQFEIATRTIENWLVLQRTTGSVEPRAHSGGARARMTPRRLGILRRLVEDDPDATLQQLASRFARATRWHVHPSTISRALRDLGLPRKKKDALRDGARPTRRATKATSLPPVDLAHPPPPSGLRG